MLINVLKKCTQCVNVLKKINTLTALVIMIIALITMLVVFVMVIVATRKICCWLSGVTVSEIVCCLLQHPTSLTSRLIKLNIFNTGNVIMCH